jgi:hypothetical protein
MRPLCPMLDQNCTSGTVTGAGEGASVERHPPQAATEGAEADTVLHATVRVTLLIPDWDRATWPRVADPHAVRGTSMQAMRAWQALRSLAGDSAAPDDLPLHTGNVTPLRPCMMLHSRGGQLTPTPTCPHMSHAAGMPVCAGRHSRRDGIVHAPAAGRGPASPQGAGRLPQAATVTRDAEHHAHPRAIAVAIRCYLGPRAAGRAAAGISRPFKLAACSTGPGGPGRAGGGRRARQPCPSRQ